MLLSCSINAQTPDYLSNDPNWRQEWTFGGSMPCLITHNYIYYTNGDSIIDGVEYKKIYQRHETTYRWMAPPPHQNCDGTSFYNKLRTLLRQDGKQIYIYESGVEDLLYDFDLAVGDTLPITWNMCTEGVYVTDIDSIFMVDHYRKIFYLNDVWEIGDFLIEGVGSNYGLLEDFPTPLLSYPSWLLCFTLNDTTYFPGYGEECDLTVKAPLPAMNTQLRAYPNPVKDKLWIDHQAGTDIYQAIVYDCAGRALLIKPEQTNPNSVLFDLSGLKPGLYILQLTNGESAISRIKLSKQ